MTTFGSRCHGGCVAGHVQVESVEGPLAIASLVGKSMPVLTRLASGLVGFRMMTKVTCTATGVGVLSVTFDNGHVAVVDRGHVFYRPGLVEQPAESLAIGDVLDASFAYPPDYVFRRADGTTEVSTGGVRVTALVDAGLADVYTALVNETQRYYLTAGVLSKA